MTLPAKMNTGIRQPCFALWHEAIELGLNQSNRYRCMKTKKVNINALKGTFSIFNCCHSSHVTKYHVIKQCLICFIKSNRSKQTQTLKPRVTWRWINKNTPDGKITSRHVWRDKKRPGSMEYNESGTSNCIQSDMHTDVYNTYTHWHTYKHTIHRHTHTHTHWHTYKHMIYPHTHTHTHTHTLTYRHTHINTHIHTDTHWREAIKMRLSSTMEIKTGRAQWWTYSWFGTGKAASLDERWSRGSRSV